MLSALKAAVVGLVGRDRANRWTSPFHDRRAARRTQSFLKALPRTGLRLNLGCGFTPFAGWVNLDGARNESVDVVWDLCRPLPFPSGSCTVVFSEHVIEHLPRDAAFRLLQECLRVLEPGGVVRLSTPDVERYLRSYAGDGEFLHHPAFTEPMDTPLDRVNQMMRESGLHLWTYDAPSLMLLLQRAGFSRCVRQEFGQSLHPLLENRDAESRAFESLYVEGVKSPAPDGAVAGEIAST